MPTQDPSESPARRVIDRIVQERFTGVLRVSSHEASGEFWFLAGTLEEARFGVSKGDEALERLLRATQVVFQAELRLPHFESGFKKPMPHAGTFAEARPVVLMRYCESYALTCSLELRGKDRTVRITYRTGELLTADAASGGNEALAAMLESLEGNYEIVLPTFELPEGVNAAPAATSVPKLSLAERIDRSLSDQSAEDAKALAELEARTQREAEAATAAAEAKRKADEASAALAKRRADEAAAAAKRKADEAAAAEAKREADEAKRKADEAAAVAKREADEAKRKADAAVAAAEAKRESDEAAEAAQRKGTDVSSTPAHEASASEPDSNSSLSENELEGSEQAPVVAGKRGFPWFWLFLALLLGGLAYFAWERLGVR